MKPCVTCGHYSQHTATGVQVCLRGDCDCTGPVTRDDPDLRLWRIEKNGQYWRVLRLNSVNSYEEVAFYESHDEALLAIECFIQDDPFELENK